MKILSRKHILLYTAAAAILGLVFAIVRTAVSLSTLEPGIELYVQGSAADDILHAVIAVCVLLLCSSALLPFSDGPTADIRRTSPLTLFAATFSGFMIVAFDLILLYDTAMDGWKALGPLLGKPPSGGITMPGAVFLLCLMLSAIPAAIYFFKVAAAGACDKPSFPVFSTFTIVFFILFALHVYFDTTTAMNSPMQIMRMLALISFVLYATHETRRILGIAMPRFYFAFAFTALFFGTVVSVSDMVLYIKNAITLKDGYLGLAIQIAYVIYILSRLLVLGTVPSNATEAEAVKKELSDT